MSSRIKECGGTVEHTTNVLRVYFGFNHAIAGREDALGKLHQLDSQAWLY